MTSAQIVNQLAKKLKENGVNIKEPVFAMMTKEDVLIEMVEQYGEKILKVKTSSVENAIASVVNKATEWSLFECWLDTFEEA